MSDEATSKSGKTWLYGVGILAAPPLLYVLSTGPVMVLAFRGVVSMGPGSFVQSAYTPLSKFAEFTAQRRCFSPT